MRYSQLFPKGLSRSSAKTEGSINQDLLTRGGFIDQLMTGSYSLLPLGWRVEQKVEKIVREEMDATGGQEIRMPLLHPRELWEETGRWESADEVMYKAEAGERDYALGFTHEEVFLDLVRKRLASHRDLPIKLYHFSHKFRRELRPRAGLLRGREFIMKDLYSLHTSREEFQAYYDAVTDAYQRAFRRMGFESHVVEAAGGVFTESHTHEFQIYVPTGEDTIYHCEKCDFAQNKEIYLGEAGDPCPRCAGEIREVRGIELGNIFPFGTVYSEKMGVTFTDQGGVARHPYFGSYGIGVSRVVGALVEAFHDERGIIWPASVAPYQVHLVSLSGTGAEVTERADRLYEELTEAGIEVLYDDRDESAGRKFGDADLIGLPLRVTISERTLGAAAVELQPRAGSEAEQVPLEGLVARLQSSD